MTSRNLIEETGASNQIYDHSNLLYSKSLDRDLKTKRRNMQTNINQTDDVSTKENLVKISNRSQNESSYINSSVDDKPARSADNISEDLIESISDHPDSHVSLYFLHSIF